MKYCPYCGTGLDVDMRFCPKCGKPFEDGRKNPHLSGTHIKDLPASETTVAVVSRTETPKKKKHIGLIAVAAVFLLAAIAAGLYFGGVFAPKEEPIIPFSDNPTAIAEVSNSVVMLSCYDKEGELYATGSGFAIFDDGVIITNYHVIEREVYRVKVETEKGVSFECPTVLAYDTDKDIAILKADRVTDLTLLIPGNSTTLQKGEKVVAIGSPLGLINSVSTGVFSGYIEDTGGTVLQFSAAISHGSSGGALFNDAGAVIGITFATLEDGQNINFAVPIEDAMTLYEASKTSKHVSMEALYDSFNHIPAIQTYTPDYVLKHYEELEGKEIAIEGYVSSKTTNNNGITSIYLVNELSDVLGYELDADDGNIYTHLNIVVEETGRSINISFNHSNQNQVDLHPSDKVIINCVIEILHGKQDGVAYTKPSFSKLGIEVVK